MRNETGLKLNDHTISAYPWPMKNAMKPDRKRSWNSIFKSQSGMDIHEYRRYAESTGLPNKYTSTKRGRNAF